MPTGNFLFRKNDGVTVDHVYTHELRARCWTCAPAGSVSASRTSASTKGCSIRRRSASRRRSSACSAARSYFPHFDFDTLSDIGDNLAGNTTHSIYSFQPTYTRMMGKHSVRAGLRPAAVPRVRRERGRAGGRLPDSQQRRVHAAAGQLDQPELAGRRDASCSACRPAGRSRSTATAAEQHVVSRRCSCRTTGRLSNRLTLNLGLRYEYEGATTDSENRNVRGFDPDGDAQHHERRPRPPTPPTRSRRSPPSAFSVRGGLQFASDDQPGFWNADRNNIQPRAGFAYKLNEKTVVRGGIGVYTVPFIIAGNFQPGFSQTTSLVPTLDSGLTFQPRWRIRSPTACWRRRARRCGAEHVPRHRTSAGSRRSISRTRRTCATR